MRWYKVKLKAKSWLSSDWHADTIWGNLCWGLKYLQGEQKLTEFINTYKASNPPLLLSNGYPDDLLPCPILSFLGNPQATLEEQKQEFRKQKDAKKENYVSYDEFSDMLGGKIVYPSRKNSLKHRITIKNQINRLTNTTGEEGNLFSFEEYRWETVTIYAKIVDGFEDTAKALFHYLAKTGYGKRKSVGYGWLDLLEFESFSGFASPKDANAFVSLSNFLPAGNDPTDGYWKAFVKYGKLGEEYGSSANPFKRPLLMFAAGSVFYDSLIRDCYGKLVTEISPSHPEVVQYGFALPVPMKLAER